MDFGQSGLVGLIVQRHVREGLDTELVLVQTLYHSTMDINVMLMVRLIGKIRIATLESAVSPIFRKYTYTTYHLQFMSSFLPVI